MKTHNVEVDDQVFLLVKSGAEPLVDTFNSSLRRLLQLDTIKHQPKETDSRSSAFDRLVPNSTPQALRQILEVATLVRSGSHSRNSATKAVAKKHGVFYQTVLDKYCRQLNLTASKFDRLLRQDEPKELRSLLLAQFQDHQDIIDAALSAW